MCSLVTIGIAFAIVVDELRPLMHLSVFVNGKKGYVLQNGLGSRALCISDAQLQSTVCMAGIYRETIRASFFHKLFVIYVEARLQMYLTSSLWPRVPQNSHGCGLPKNVIDSIKIL